MVGKQFKIRGKKTCDQNLKSLSAAAAVCGGRYSMFDDFPNLMVRNEPIIRACMTQ
jgi:hypothetical protein